MTRPGRSGPDPGIVLAARTGDRRALDTLVAGSLPLVYNIVGRALRGHPDTDDVVQETLLRLVRHLAELRDPAAYRSWLVAITVRQVRDWQHGHRTGAAGAATVEVPDEVPDPAGDFAELTILRLGLTDQRREVAEATRWLDPDDRELLALWWLEESGELDRAELATALGLPAGHVAVRVHRMKEQLDVARAVVRALRARPGCPELPTVARGWDGVPAPLWRKRLARHVRDCVECGRAGRDLLPVGRLLAGLPLLPVPPGLGERLTAYLGGDSSVQPGGEWAAQPGAAHPRPVGPSATDDQHHSGQVGAPDGPVRSSGAHAAPPRGLGRWFGAGTGGVAGPVSAAAAVAGLVVAVLLAVQLSRPDEAETTAAAGPEPAPGVAATASAGPSPSLAGTPTPSAGGPTPTATPSRRTSSRPAAPAAPARASEKKGVAVWNFSGVSQALANSGASWYYTWAAHHDGVTTPRGVQFVPMIWGRDHVTSANLARAKNAGPYLLGFNEPDLAGQAEMSVEEALDLWPKLQATGSRLGSPAVAFGGDRAGGWLDRFMVGAKERGHRVDFIALHWYGGDFRTANAVSQLRSYLQAVYERYRKPIWLTEFALIDFSSGQARFPSQQQQAAFVTAAAKMLGGLSYLQRYAWFGLPATDKDLSGLFRGGAQPTAVGRAFQAAG
ncbi:sigma-70 family RNA polymerase sigma factor [Plantactinospora sonchi]|uniref:Sigma-70 family RNA polymerase sigma factor n=1 Tax=Plantactinospora sonchi TaxID=1544735 RepID=A0ABU7RLD4_9ACTN